MHFHVGILFHFDVDMHRHQIEKEISLMDTKKVGAFLKQLRKVNIISIAKKRIGEKYK